MYRIHHLLRTIGIVAAVVSLALHSAPVEAANTTAALPKLGHTLNVDGFNATPSSVMRAREAGSADYVASRGRIFLLVTVRIQRAGGHDSYLADPQDWHIQASNGDVIDSEQFGMKGELTARHVYSKPVGGTIGFDVPANDKGLILLWQPGFNSNPDAQGEWLIGSGGKLVQYFQ